MQPRFLDDLDARAGEDGETPLRFTDAELRALTPEDAAAIGEHFAGQAMMCLPSWEVTFFTWLQREDPAVWEDLWGGDTEPYIVSIAFLPAFLPGGHGFPVCDLVAHDNYYFHKDFLIEPDGRAVLDHVMDKVRKQEQITLAEAFLLEVLQHPIDIWRFAFRYHITPADARAIADAYTHDGVLLHLKDSTEIADFVEL